MIDVGKFSKPALSADKNSFFRFDISKENAAAELRRLADAVEAGLILLQKVQAGQVVSIDDFYTQAIMIEFAEREVVERVKGAEEKDLIGLYGDGRKFPIAVGKS